MADSQGRGSVLRLRVWIAVAILGVSLAVVAVTPVLVSVQTRALRQTITEVAEPTISAASGIERALAQELAALRGYALSGDGTYLERFDDLRAEEQHSVDRLEGLAGQLDPEIDRHARRLADLTADWHAGVDSRLAALAAGVREEPGSSAGLAGEPEALLAEVRSLRLSVELVERLRRADIARVEAFEIWLNRAMLVLAALAGVSLALLGRQLHDLAAASEEDRARLAREVDRRARLIRGISHDLKNPLGVADAHAQLIEGGFKGPVSEDLRHSVDAIRRSVGSTVRLIDDLLHLARAERGEIPIHPLPVDFGRLVAQAAADFRSRAEAEDLRLLATVPDTPVEGVTDERRVREILDNLVSNAIRYTPPGGDVRIEVAVGDDHAAGRDAVRIAVTDTGPGIAPADQERVFDEFERVEYGREGSGLGLAISREMARLLGGEIRLESHVGQGSCFTLFLPREAPVSQERR